MERTIVISLDTEYFEFDYNYQKVLLANNGDDSIHKNLIYYLLFQ